MAEVQQTPEAPEELPPPVAEEGDGEDPLLFDLSEKVHSLFSDDGAFDALQDRLLQRENSREGCAGPRNALWRGALPLGMGAQFHNGAQELLQAAAVDENSVPSFVAMPAGKPSPLKEPPSAARRPLAVSAVAPQTPSRASSDTLVGGQGVGLAGFPGIGPPLQQQREDSRAEWLPGEEESLDSNQMPSQLMRNSQPKSTPGAAMQPEATVAALPALAAAAAGPAPARVQMERSAQAKAKAEARRAKNNFRVQRLGVPSPNGNARPVPERVPEPRDCVSYIHIPRHALKDFQTFARTAAAEARRESATDNPYIQALRKHRAELQNYSVIPEEHEERTPMQQLSTEREALSVLQPRRGLGLDLHDVGGFGDDVAAERFGSSSYAYSGGYEDDRGYGGINSEAQRGGYNRGYGGYQPPLSARIHEFDETDFQAPSCQIMSWRCCVSERATSKLVSEVVPTTSGSSARGAPPTAPPPLGGTTAGYSSLAVRLGPVAAFPTRDFLPEQSPRGISMSPHRAARADSPDIGPAKI